MASSNFHLLLLLSLITCYSSQILAQITYHNRPNSVILPVIKDSSTLQYITPIQFGTQLKPIKLAVDLGGPFLWVDCDSSPSSRSIADCSIQCSTAKTTSDLASKNCFSTRRICDLTVENSIVRSSSRSEVVEDTVAVRSKFGQIMEVDDFLFTRGPSSLLNGLVSGAKGMVGLGSTRIGFPSQISNKLGLQRKFTTCLSSHDGVVLIGNNAEVSKSLMYTPLVKNSSGKSQDYFVNVNSIKISGRKISIGKNGIQSTRISSVVPYTNMRSSIYNTFVKAYVTAAQSMNMTRVVPVTPFGHCFGSTGAQSNVWSQMVPTIDFVLQSEMVKWRVNGMVKVSDEVMCLGFMDGGVNLGNAIVIGGFQLEDTLLEFDLDRSMLGFSSSSSSLVGEKFCSASNFVFESMI